MYQKRGGGVPEVNSCYLPETKQPNIHIHTGTTTEAKLYKMGRV